MENNQNADSINEEVKNKKNTTKRNNKKINNKRGNKKQETSNSIEKDLEKIGKLIQIVKIIFIIVVIGIFVWIIGKDLIKALGIVNIDSEELNQSSYDELIEDAISGR